MKTYLDCIPCFLRQSLDYARIAKASQARQRALIEEVLRLVAKMPSKMPPPEIARLVYRVIQKHTKKKDLFNNIKKYSNDMALDFYPKLKNMMRDAQDKLLEAVEIAIAGNIIDYGVKNSLEVKKEVDVLFSGGFKKSPKNIFDYKHFKNDIKKAKNILYIGDNAGEIVFDKILLEELVFLQKNVVFAVRSAPVINDITINDARYCGIDNIVKVISSGSDAPGTILKICTKEFLRIYNKADIIISKGQGNFETLSDEKRPIYFLFKVKCPVITKHIEDYYALQCKLGDIVLKRIDNK